MLIGLGEVMTLIDIVFTMLKVMVTRVTFVKNVTMVFAHYLETFLSQSLHILYAD